MKADTSPAAAPHAKATPRRRPPQRGTRHAPVYTLVAELRLVLALLQHRLGSGVPQGEGQRLRSPGTSPYVDAYEGRQDHGSPGWRREGERGGTGGTSTWARPLQALTRCALPSPQRS